MIVSQLRRFSVTWNFQAVSLVWLNPGDIIFTLHLLPVWNAPPAVFQLLGCSLVIFKPLVDFSTIGLSEEPGSERTLHFSCLRPFFTCASAIGARCSSSGFLDLSPQSGLPVVIELSPIALSRSIAFSSGSSSCHSESEEPLLLSKLGEMFEAANSCTAFSCSFFAFLAKCLSIIVNITFWVLSLILCLKQCLSNFSSVWYFFCLGLRLLKSLLSSRLRLFCFLGSFFFRFGLGSNTLVFSMCLAC